MALRAVQKTNENPSSPHILSYTKCAAAGALIGYSLKHFLPVTPQEKDENFNSVLDEIKVKAKEAELAEVAKIRKLRNKSEAADTFIRMYDAKKLDTSEIGRIKPALVNDVMQFFAQVNNKIQEINTNELKKLKESVKNIRPTGVFIGIGLTIGLLIAVINNVVNRILAENTI